MASTKITDDDIKKLRVSYTKAEQLPITCLDFHYNGELLVETLEDKLKVFTLRDEVQEAVFTVRTPAKITKFFDNQHVIHSSNKDHKLKAMNFVTSQYYAYYAGHTDEVVSLAVASQCFFTGSEDKTARKWDPRIRVGVGTIRLSDTPFVTNFCDKTLAVAYNSSVTEIYDNRNLKEYVHRFQYEKRAQWNGIQFSPDGKMLMITTDSTYIFIVNSSEKQEMHELSGFQNPDGIHLDAAFSCDSKYVFGGSTDGKLHVWELEKSSPLCQIKSGYEGPCERVAFNPAFMNVATTSNSNVLHLWIEKI